MIKPLPAGGRQVKAKTPYGDFDFQAFESFTDAQIVVDGRVVGMASMQIRTPPHAALHRPPEHIPARFDPATERHGCCDPPPDV